LRDSATLCSSGIQTPDSAGPCTADEQHSSRAGWHLDHLRNCRGRHRVLGPKDRTTFSLNQDSRGGTVKQLAGEPPSKRSGARLEAAHGAPLLVRSCFRGLAIIRFGDLEEIARSLTNLHGQLSVLRPTSFHCLAGSFSTLLGRKPTRTGLSAPTAEFYSSGVLWCHQCIFITCLYVTILSAT
jgi:hypothetical protein